jgi:hypothetical protein
MRIQRTHQRRAPLMLDVRQREVLTVIEPLISLTFLLAFIAIINAPPIGIILFIVGFILIKVKNSNEKKEQLKSKILAEESVLSSQKELQYQYESTLQAAKSGDPSAQYQYGLMVLQGKGCKASPEIGLSWLSCSANTGFCEAQEMIGVIYENGQYGASKDHEKALDFYRKAAASGSTLSKEKVITIENHKKIEERKKQEKILLEASESEWSNYSNFLSMCESEPELILLKSLIQRANLKPFGKNVERISDSDSASKFT